MAVKSTILQADENGSYAIPSLARADVQRIDISDVDLVVTSKAGEVFIIPSGGISAMGNAPPNVVFSDGPSSTAQLLGEVGAALNLDVEVTMPTSLEKKGDKGGGATKEELIQKLHKIEQKVHQQEQKIHDQQKIIQQQQQNVHKDDHKSDEQSPQSVSTLTENTETSVEQMVQKIDKIEENLHRSDYDYVPPFQFQPPANPPAAPPGLPPPISLTPIVGLYMGNVVGTTSNTTDNPGYTTYYGGGGAVGSDAAAQIGPRNALQFSAATITAGAGANIIYADGPLVGNSTTRDASYYNGTATTYYSKQLIVSVAGYFTSLSGITISNLPAGVSIAGATANGNGSYTLPATYVTQGLAFTLVYSTAQTGSFDMNIEIQGATTRGENFDTTQSFRFEFLNETSVSQVTNSGLLYDSGDGSTKEIYVLPTSDQPNIITAGDGNNIVYGSRSNDTVTLGNGNNTLYEGGGANTIVMGNGSNLITVYGGTTGSGTITLGTSDNSGSGNNNIIHMDTATGNTDAYTISLYGSGTQTINFDNGYAGDGNYTVTMYGSGVLNAALGAGTDTITTFGSAATISAGTMADAGNHTVYINSTTGSTGLYSITLNGTGTQTVSHQTGSSGDGIYNITMGGTGTHLVNIGNGTNGTNSQITLGDGTNTVTTGNGQHTISAGNGLATITTGSGNDAVTLASGGGVINLGDGTNSLTTNTGAATGSYTITAGAGNDTINLSAGTGVDTVRAGLGTNSIAFGTGANVMDFSDITTTPLAINLSADTATGTSVSDTLSGTIAKIIGTNQGDTITLGTTAVTVMAGTGNDTITLGTVADIVYAGNGNNSIAGHSSTTLPGAMLYGGTGNNTFLSPDAGTTYNGTNGTAMSLVANNLVSTYTNTSATNPFASIGATGTLDSYTNPVTGAQSYITYTYNGTSTVYSFYLGTQLNEINYSADSAAETINLSYGTNSGGIGGTAAGSVYAFTPTLGYNSINEILLGTGTDTVYASYSDTVMIGGTTTNVQSFYDEFTTANQQNIMIGGTGGTRFYYMGLAHETIVANGSTNVIEYGLYTVYASQGAIAINLDSVSHTFTNSLYAAPITIAAYSGTNWGVDDANSALSMSAGDYFAPINGTSTGINTVEGSYLASNLVYGGTSYMAYQNINPSINVSDYFYAGSGGGIYYFSNGNDVYVGYAGATNIFDANGFGPYAVRVILSKANDPNSADQSVSLTSGGASYTGFAYGWGNVTNTTTSNGYTLLANVEMVVGNAANNYIVGDNNSNQINSEGGQDTIINGSGTNIITLIQGADTITNASASVHYNDILNFETVNNGNSGILASFSSGNNTSVEAFLNYATNSTQTSFFSSGADETTFYGSSTFSAFQVRTGTGGSYSYSSVQSTIVSEINGSDYHSSAAINTAVSAATASSSTNAAFIYDNVYSGAATIIGHTGANIYIDNIGTATEQFTTTADSSDLFYATAAQIPSLHITSSASHLGILRVEGWGATTTTGNAFGTSDPFSSTQITGITEIDVRKGTDSVNASSLTVTLGGGSVTNTSTPTFNLSSADIQNITGVSSTPTLILKLDSGDVFTPTGTLSSVTSGSTISYYNSTTVHTSATLIATDTHNTSLYYSDILVFNSANTAHLQIHYGTG